MTTLADEIFVLLHHSEEQGCLVDLAPDISEMIAVGGILVELVLAGRVRLEPTSVVVLDDCPSGDAVLDEVLGRLTPSVSVDTADPEWIGEVVEQLPVGHLVLARLIESGIVTRQESRRRFGLSRYVTYPVADDVLTSLADSERRVMLADEMPDPDAAARLFLCFASGKGSLLGSLDRSDRKRYQRRADALFGDYWGQLDEPAADIEGLDPAARSAIGEIAVSWGTTQAARVQGDVARWRYWLDLADL